MRCGGELLGEAALQLGGEGAAAAGMEGKGAAVAAGLVGFLRIGLDRVPLPEKLSAKARAPRLARGAGAVVAVDAAAAAPGPSASASRCCTSPAVGRVRTMISSDKCL